MNPFTAQKMTFSIKKFFSKRDQIRISFGCGDYLDGFVLSVVILGRTAMKEKIFNFTLAIFKISIRSENFFVLTDAFTV